MKRIVLLFFFWCTMFLISLLSCTSSLNIDITKHTNDDDSEVTSSTPCTITIYKQSEIESPYIDVTITSAEKIIIQLELYGGKELLQREVLLPTTGSHTVEMFWPKQTQNHTWQEQYGTNATLTAIGFSGNEETCRETLEEEFSSIDDRIQSSRFITSPNWNVESAQANGLHVSVPALHESDKFALISTPLSQTLLSVIGPFSREDIFRDLTNLSVFEDSKGNFVDKDKILNKFLNRKIDILISTTVIEVGIDFPNANVIIIENSNKFGLSQLHQLRGRVGRGNKESFCILMFKKNLSKNARKRINILKENNDGFKISEEDMKLRGYGDLLGFKQSGVQSFRLADPVLNEDLFILAEKETKRIERDNINLNKFQSLLKLYDRADILNDIV